MDEEQWEERSAARDIAETYKQKCVELAGEITRLTMELAHEKERHRLEMENLVLRVEAELKEMDRQSQSRFPVLSRLLTQFEAMSTEVIAEARIPPDPPDPPEQ